MLKSERMSKLFVVGPKSRLEKVVSKLHELKVAHFIEHKKDEFDICTPLASFEKVSSLLLQVRSLNTHLNISSDNTKLSKFKFKKLEKEIASIKDEVNRVIDETKKAEDEISLISEQKKALKLMTLLNVRPENFKKSSYIKSYLGEVNDTKIKEKLENITDRYEIYTAVDGKKTLIALFVDSNFATQFEKVLAEASFSETDTTSTNSLEGDAEELFEKLLEKDEKFQVGLKIKQDKLKKIAGKHNVFLADAEKFLSIEAEKAQAPLSFGSTREAFFLRCYLPEKDKEKVKNEISKAAANKLHIVEEPLGNEEEIPIKLQNSKYTKNFEFFTRVFALPKYNEFDPSALMAYTFPLFYGFMLGDVIYGLIVFALFYWLKKKFPIGKDFFNILLAAAVSAIIFGFLYGEFAGLELYHLFIQRTHDFNTLMIISVIAGIVHVNFGLILGFIMELKHHGFMKAANGKLSWMILQVGGVLFLGPLLGMLTLPSQSLFYLGVILFIIAVIMLFKAEGYIGLMEIPSILTHIMSYARLMAVGLASVFIAVLVNDLITFLFHKGILFWPLALIALVIGHTFNIALGILSPSLHAVRLHYVEFFSKFYQGGGIDYVPFGEEKQKSLF